MNTNFIVIGLTRRGIKPESVAQEADPLSNFSKRPCYNTFTYRDVLAHGHGTLAHRCTCNSKIFIDSWTSPSDCSKYKNVANHCLGFILTTLCSCAMDNAGRFG